MHQKDTSVRACTCMQTYVQTCTQNKILEVKENIKQKPLFADVTADSSDRTDEALCLAIANTQIHFRVIYLATSNTQIHL